MRLAALLLFGKDDALRRFVPNHEVAFQVLRGLEVEVNDFFRWPLMRVMEEIEARIRARNREQELMVGLLRVGRARLPGAGPARGAGQCPDPPRLPAAGGGALPVAPDRIEISNPGGFPEGVRLDNLLVTAPRPRNPLLADAFKRAGIVERTARGIDTIFYEQLRNGRPAPSYARSDRRRCGRRHSRRRRQPGLRAPAGHRGPRRARSGTGRTAHPQRALAGAQPRHR